jgi:hypothetical protein
MTANRPEASCKNDTLVCIGEGVHLSGKNLHLVADLFLSTNGGISVAVRSSTGNASAISSFISRIGFSGLDMIASDYYYKSEGQAFGIVDIMARHGHITFSQAASFRAAVEARAMYPIIFFIGDIRGPR